MSSTLRVEIEQGPRGKVWVAVAADWPGLERNGRSEDLAVEKLLAYMPRYAPVAARAGLDAELAEATDVDIIERYTGTGSTDFWGISFAPSGADRLPIDDAAFERRLALLRATWAEFDDTAARVSEELRLGPRGGGRDRYRITRHVLGTEGVDFAKRVKVPSATDDLLPMTGREAHRDRYVEAMREWRAEGKPLGNWTIPYLLRHSAYHVMDHTWEMQDRDLSGDDGAA